MPFNGSGTFSIVNVFVPNTTILSAAVNQNFTDIATGLSDCLTRDGQAGMTAVFKAISGSVSAPGISFNSDTTSGLYLASSGKVGLVSRSGGLVLDTNLFCAQSATVQAGGSGYAIGDTITEAGGTSPASLPMVFIVATLSGSAVATVTVGYSGFYSVVPSNPVSQTSTSGSGTGCTLNVTYNNPAGADYRVFVGTQAGVSPWGFLGASSFVAGLMAKAKALDFVRSLVTIGSGLTLSSSTNPPTLTTTLNPTLVPNYLSGLTMSTAGSSATMTIAAGVANDTTNTTLMNLSSAISKTTASWAVGTGNGGLDTGAIANSTWYHFYEIERVDTGLVDVVFSTNATTPTLPTNYTLYRRIGSGKTNGSAQWTAFVQFGDDFLWLAPSTGDVNTSTLAGAPTSFTLAGVPTGIKVFAHLTGVFGNAAANVDLLIQSPDATGAGPNSPGGLITARTVTAGLITTFITDIRTNTSAQIVAYGNAANCTLIVATKGWLDIRGKI